jgi:two-component system response regulator PilR (NtrC family)
MSTLDLNSRVLVSAGSGSVNAELVRETAISAGGQTAWAIPVLSADMEGRVTACNAAAAELFHSAHRRILGSNLVDILSTEEFREPQIEKLMLTEILGAGQYRSQCQCRGQDGKDFQVEFSLSLLRDGRAVPTGMIALFLPSSADTVAAAKVSTQRKAGTVPGALATLEDEDESPKLTSREIDGSLFVLASPLMHRFMKMTDRVAGHTETVLITGETGTGKELIARTIHRSSHRRSRPWVDINCAALPENLVESELFGYEKGAFTGADVSKPGLFEMADKGTLFLDEIGELQLQTQVKLLRVLDGYPFYRLGGHKKITVDVRIVAATNQDLDAAVTSGRFREDLFHRLGQFQLRVPPLRERPEDIVALAEYFLGLKNSASSFTPAAVSALLSYSWPGNVRELRNLVARVSVQAVNREIQPEQITAAMSGSPTALRQTASIPVGNLDSMEEQMIIRALERSGGHRAQAAEQLGISRRTLSRKLKEYHINVPAGDGASPLGSISLEQQKFFRARTQLTVTVKNQQGEEAIVQGVNLSTGGMGLDGLKDPMRFSGLLEVSFPLPDSESVFRAKARIVWMGDEGRVGVRFSVIDPALFEQLQHWTNKKMKDEGWELPA